MQCRSMPPSQDMHTCRSIRQRTALSLPGRASVCRVRRLAAHSHDPPSGGSWAWEAQGASLGDQPKHYGAGKQWHGVQPAQQQQYQPTVQPLPGAHPPLKYAQMGHSSYGRGAPHVCCMQLGPSQGLFYSRAHQQQQQQQAWSSFAASVAHAAEGILQGHSRARSLLAAAAAAPGAAPSASSIAETAVTDTESSSTSTSSSGSDGPAGSQGPQWHVVVLQGLMLAAALLVAGLLLKQFCRGVVAALVACYSGLPFKI